MEQDKQAIEAIAKLPRIRTCVKCKYWKTCIRTLGSNLSFNSDDYSEMLCQAEVDTIFNKLASLGYVKLADSQTPPKFSFSEEPPNMRFGYQKAQSDMLSVDSEGCKWVRVRVK